MNRVLNFGRIMPTKAVGRLGELIGDVDQIARNEPSLPFLDGATAVGEEVIKCMEFMSPVGGAEEYIVLPANNVAAALVVAVYRMKTGRLPKVVTMKRGSDCNVPDFIIDLENVGMQVNDGRRKGG